MWRDIPGHIIGGGGNPITNIYACVPGGGNGDLSGACHLAHNIHMHAPTHGHIHLRTRTAHTHTLDTIYTHVQRYIAFIGKSLMK